MSAPPTAAPAASPPAAPGRGTPPPSVEVRNAALLLHALPATDREWLLARLSDPERALLRALVSELETLGIPADPALVEEVTASPPAARRAPAPAAAAAKETGNLPARAGDAPRASLDDVDPALLAEVLCDEPAGLVARLLMMGEWRWRNALLDELEAGERRRVEEVLARAGAAGAGVPAAASTAAGGGAALREHLFAKLCERVAQRESRRAEETTRTGGAGRRRAPPARPTRWLSRLLRKGARP